MEGKKCPKCNRIIPYESNICIHCGFVFTKVTDSSPLPDIKQQLTNQEPERIQASEYFPSSKKKNSLTTGGICFIIICIIIVFTIIISIAR